MPAGAARPGRRERVRHALGALLAFGALEAFGGGWHGLSGAPAAPVEWLADTPFRP